MHTPHPDVTLPVGTGGLLEILNGSGVAETARRCAEAGNPVLPCPSDGTHSITTQNYSDATPDSTQVADDAAVPAPAIPVCNSIREDQ